MIASTGMPEPACVRVAVLGPDSLTAESIAKLLETESPLVRGARRSPDVTLVFDERCSPSTLDQVRAAAEFEAPIVLVSADVQESSVLALLNHGVVTVLDRSTTTSAELVDAVLGSAAGSAALPPQLLRSLISQVRSLQRDVLAPLGYTSTGLSQREIEILRMLADGAGTRDIARALTYSESTVKRDLGLLISRFRFRNRTQAVAFAIRAGVL